MRGVTATLVFLTLIILIATAVVTQETTGAIVGTVLSAAGHSLAGVTVSLDVTRVPFGGSSVAESTYPGNGLTISHPPDNDAVVQVKE